MAGKRDPDDRWTLVVDEPQRSPAVMAGKRPG